ncbi:hypothetical protein JKY72_03365 [Candidatus Gracilibacteria bacterium]|nr:hypothetical protein [Candidatus Gracilibacteria bacterium]
MNKLLPLVAAMVLGSGCGVTRAEHESFQADTIDLYERQISELVSQNKVLLGLAWRATESLKQCRNSHQFLSAQAEGALSDLRSTRLVMRLGFQCLVREKEARESKQSRHGKK